MRLTRFSSGVLLVVLIGASVAPHLGYGGELSKKKTELACTKPENAVQQRSEAQAAAQAEALIRGAVDASAGANAGELKEYQTVVLTSDAYDRAWTRYELCRQHAAGLMNEETYSRLLTPLLIAPGTGATPALPPPVVPVAVEKQAESTPAVVIAGPVVIPSPKLNAVSAAPTSPGLSPTAYQSRVLAAKCANSSLAGTWNVVSTYTGVETCNNMQTGTTQAYIWLVSIQANCQVQVDVQGQTYFPTLIGVLDGNSLVLEGPGNMTAIDDEVTLQDASWFLLNVAEDRIEGVRRYIGVEAERDEVYGEYVTLTPCFVDSAIVATR